MNTGHDIAVILIDSFEEAGIHTEGRSFYDLMFVLWMHQPEAFDAIVKGLTKEVIDDIKAILGGAA